MRTHPVNSPRDKKNARPKPSVDFIKIGRVGSD
jgi:hypothetical protein